MSLIYLDNAATTPPDKVLLKSCVDSYISDFYNPSATYAETVRTLIEQARRDVLATLTDDTDKWDLIFTSGGTEADNLAFNSLRGGGYYLISAGEHAAVYNAAIARSKHTDVRGKVVRVTAYGDVDKKDLLDTSFCDPDFVSIVHVNNETGAINDITSLSNRVKAANPACVFHSDGVQAWGKVPAFRLSDDIDMYSVSAHKIGGIKGVGALIFRKDSLINPLLYGGGQEHGFRGGTENTLGILHMGMIARNIDVWRGAFEKVKTLRNLLIALLDKKYFYQLSPNGGSPYILTVSAIGQSREVIQQILSERGIFVGTGSACGSGKAFSRVLSSCGFNSDILSGELRFSFSPQTTEEEVEQAAEAVNSIVKSGAARILY